MTKNKIKIKGGGLGDRGYVWVGFTTCALLLLYTWTCQPPVQKPNHTSATVVAIDDCLAWLPAGQDYPNPKGISDIKGTSFDGLLWLVDTCSLIK